MSTSQQPAHDPMYEVVDIPGKGKGLIALRDIPRGTRILFEEPLFFLPDMPRDLLSEAVAAGLKTLSKDEQRQFLSLHNNFPGKGALGGLFLTNALPFSFGLGIYPTICRINHSCGPNTYRTWNHDAKREAIHAITPIPAGQEITIGYGAGGPFAARQARLLETFRFRCTCRVCVLDPAARRASDIRRLNMKELSEAIARGRVRAPAACLRACHALLQIQEMELPGFGANAPRAYYDAYQICISNGDQARASVLAERTYQGRLVCEGDTVITQRLRALAMNPARDEKFGITSKRWGTLKNMVPEGLDAAQFDAWLFMLEDSVSDE